MDNATARTLCALNNEFYAREAMSFSATREVPWPGWRRVLGAIAAAQLELDSSSRALFSSRVSDEKCESAHPAGASSCSECDNDADDSLFLVDVACGNMRFERFLNEEYPHEFLALAVDSCDRLALDALKTCDFDRSEVSYTHIDVIEQLLDGGTKGLAFSLGTKSADATVAFGFMHHIPGEENRTSFLRALLDTVRSGGIVAVSLWRFMDDERLAKKAHEATVRARSYVADAVSGRAPLDEEMARSSLFAVDFTQFEAGDYLLGWRDDVAAFRYCHSFNDAEIARLIDSVSNAATLIDRFTADGKTGNLNEYLVFGRK